jgi:hypothetical protein
LKITAYNGKYSIKMTIEEEWIYKENEKYSPKAKIDIMKEVL